MDRDDRRLFADGLLYHFDEWLLSQQWIAHRGLDLPVDWLEWLLPGDQYERSVKRYLAAADRGQPVAFGQPREVIDNGTWSYQDALNHEPCAINADVREFFEALVPDGEWSIATAHYIEGDGPIYALVHPEDGIRVVVAGYDPRVADSAEAA